MPSYTIKYPWTFNPHGPDGGRYADQDIDLIVAYHVQPDEPDVNVQFEITIEEITDGNGGHFSTDANFECGWYQSDQERLYDWLLDNWADGKRTGPTLPLRNPSNTGSSS